MVVKKGSKQAIVDLAQQLAWIGAAFRVAATGHVELSVAKIESVANAYWGRCFFFTFDNRGILEGEEKCWYPLVSASTACTASFCHDTLVNGDFVRK